MKFLMQWLVDYAAIILGLAIGAIAHFGNLIEDGRWPGVWKALGYLMQLALVGLFSAVVVEQMGIISELMKTTTAAVMAVSAQEVVQFLKRNGWRKFAGHYVDEDMQ